MKINRKIACLGMVALGMVAASIGVQAAPVKDEPVQIVQPNGTELSEYITGDEYVHFVHDKDKYIIVQNDNGEYVYADYADGEVVETDYVVGQDDNTGYITLDDIPNEYYQNKRIEAENEAHNGADVELYDTTANSGYNEFKGDGTVFVLPVQFNGGETFVDEEDIMYNFKDVSKFYSTVSYGQLNLNVKNMAIDNDVYTDSHSVEYYKQYSSSNPKGYYSYSRFSRECELVRGALNYYGLSNASVDENVDLDGDGKVDFIILVYKKTSSISWDGLLWAHFYGTESNLGSINGSKITNWMIVSNKDIPKTLWHEMYHAIGAPDLYSYNYSYADYWDLAAGGKGTMSAYCKYMWGHWIENIPEITEDGEYNLNSIDKEDNNCYAIKLNDYEYYIVEFRKFDGGVVNCLNTQYHRNIYMEGLRIYKVNTKYANKGNAQCSLNALEMQACNDGIIRDSLGQINAITGPFCDNGVYEIPIQYGTDKRIRIDTTKVNEDGSIKIKVLLNDTEQYAPIKYYGTYDRSDCINYKKIETLDNESEITEITCTNGQVMYNMVPNIALTGEYKLYTQPINMYKMYTMLYREYEDGSRDEVMDKKRYRDGYIEFNEIILDQTAYVCDLDKYKLKGDTVESVSISKDSYGILGADIVYVKDDNYNWRSYTVDEIIKNGISDIESINVEGNVVKVSSVTLKSDSWFNVYSEPTEESKMVSDNTFIGCGGVELRLEKDKYEYDDDSDSVHLGYTLDGTEPTEYNHIEYTEEPIIIDKDTELKIVVFDTREYEKSKVYSYDYKVINEESLKSSATIYDMAGKGIVIKDFMENVDTIPANVKVSYKAGEYSITFKDDKNKVYSINNPTISGAMYVPITSEVIEYTDNDTELNRVAIDVNNNEGIEMGVEVVNTDIKVSIKNNNNIYNKSLKVTEYKDGVLIRTSVYSIDSDEEMYNNVYNTRGESDKVNIALFGSYIEDGTKVYISGKTININGGVEDVE